MKKVILVPVATAVLTTFLAGGALAATTQLTPKNPNYDSVLETLDVVATPALTNKNSNTNIKFSTDGSLTLGDSTDVPRIYDSAKKFGMITSDIIHAKKPFQSVSLDLKESKKNKRYANR